MAVFKALKNPGDGGWVVRKMKDVAKPNSIILLLIQGVSTTSLIAQRRIRMRARGALGVRGALKGFKDAQRSKKQREH